MQLTAFQLEIIEMSQQAYGQILNSAIVSRYKFYWFLLF